ncbi:MAG: phosphoglycerol geranylgeranyltransferase [Methanoculleaceae archaeon]
MSVNWKNWRHVTKLDPDKEISLHMVEDIAVSGTDALMLSGTLNVTPEKVIDLRDMVMSYGLPLVVEPADPSVAILEGIDLLFVPSVLNTSSLEWLIGRHVEWVRNEFIDWERVVPEAYIVLNPDSAVARVTGSNCALDSGDVSVYATLADRYFGFPIVYIEYSGVYGDPNVVHRVSTVIENARLFYGGGINSPARAAEMGQWADTIVVGNAVYEAGTAALKETVRALI